LTARANQSLVWDRARHVLRLRSALHDFFPAALKAFRDLDAPDALELLARAPGPDQTTRLTKSRIIAALTCGASILTSGGGERTVSYSRSKSRWDPKPTSLRRWIASHRKGVRIGAALLVVPSIGGLSMTW
jgi:hypothetical protein